MAKNNRYVEKQKQNDQAAAATWHINFGAIVFLMIFIYMVVLLINFAVKENVNYTIAEAGVLSHSAEYTGLVIRNETLVNAGAEGHLKYFFPEGARVRSGNSVIGIVTDQEMMTLLEKELKVANQNLSADDPVFDESYGYLKDRIKNYVINQHHQPYGYTYDAKKQIKNDIEEIRNTIILQHSGSAGIILDLEEQYANSVVMMPAPSSGLVSYKIDGMEDITRESFVTTDLKREPSIQESSAKTYTEPSQPVFKVVDNYLWYIAAEIDDACEKQIEGKTYIGVEFLDKEISLDVRAFLFDEGPKTYLILEIDRMVNHFLTDRYTDFRITYDDHKGVKIPESAVTKKTFAVIPSKYLTVVNQQFAVRKKVVSEDTLGQETLDPTTIKILKREGDQVYVPLDDRLQIGDVVSYTDPDSYATTEFVIEETIELEGVYVINKGYAVFKFIDTIYREKDYRIVDANLDYGVRIYDRIATEASLTEEYQIIN